MLESVPKFYQSPPRLGHPQAPCPRAVDLPGTAFDLELRLGLRLHKTNYVSIMASRKQSGGEHSPWYQSNRRLQRESSRGAQHREGGVRAHDMKCHESDAATIDDDEVRSLKRLLQRDIHRISGLSPALQFILCPTTDPYFVHQVLHVYCCNHRKGKVTTAPSTERRRSGMCSYLFDV